ncbi:MAG: carbamate kinase [bacterium]|nr:carbamate kinase [bacterium]
MELWDSKPRDATELIYNGKPVILALGGNAVIKAGQKGDIYEQFANTRETARSLLPLIKGGAKLIITHGNGPQVGHRLIMSKAAADVVPEVPLGVLVADTQGSMGYMIQQTLKNVLVKADVDASVVTVVTQVLVDPTDQFLREFRKPIGPFFDEATALRRMEEDPTIVMKDDAGRGWRRFVPSPLPIGIVELPTIKSLIEAGSLVISCGGGGIPVYKDSRGNLEGVDAVIDKDRASSLLAIETGVDLFIIATTKEQVYLNFQTPEQKPLDIVTTSEAERYQDEGHFAAGSMYPKVESIISFLKNGGKHAIITTPWDLERAVRGECGTHFVAG